MLLRGAPPLRGRPPTARHALLHAALPPHALAERQANRLERGPPVDGPFPQVGRGRGRPPGAPVRPGREPRTEVDGGGLLPYRQAGSRGGGGGVDRAEVSALERRVVPVAPAPLEGP